MTVLRQRMLDDMRIRNYSANTQRCYISYVRRFAEHFKCSPDRLTPEHVRSYLLHLVNDGVGEGVLTNTVCALRFLYRVTLQRDWSITARDLPFTKRAKKLPVVLSLDETQKFLVSLGNVKHRAILATLYDCGLRVSELLALTAEDIDSSRMLIHVKLGKGMKDRYVPLSTQLLEQLRQYWREYRPSTHVFEGGARGPPHEEEASRADLQQGSQGSRNTETSHSAHAQAQLRYASPGSWNHIRILQRLLGHSGLNSTARYLHIAENYLDARKTPLELHSHKVDQEG